MSEPTDGGGEAKRADGGAGSHVETALFFFVVLAVLFVVSAAGVALLLL